jgi:hypothetical protein
MRRVIIKKIAYTNKYVGYLLYSYTTVNAPLDLKSTLNVTVSAASCPKLNDDRIPDGTVTTYPPVVVNTSVTFVAFNAPLNNTVCPASLPLGTVHSSDPANDREVVYV